MKSQKCTMKYVTSPLWNTCDFCTLNSVKSLSLDLCRWHTLLRSTDGKMYTAGGFKLRRGKINKKSLVYHKQTLCSSAEIP